jgi:TolA-binding protein
MGVVVLMLVLLGLTRFPASLRAGTAFTRGRRAEAAGQYAVAAKEYRVVLERFPDCTKAIQRLGVSEYRAGNMREAVQALRQLSGRSADEASIREVNQVVGEIQQRLSGASQPRHRYDR